MWDVRALTRDAVHPQTSGMTELALRRLAYALLVLAVALDIAGLALQQGLHGVSGLRDTNGADPGDLLFVTAVGSAGTLIAHHRPRNTVAWLLLGCGLAEALASFGGAYGARALALPTSSLPLGAWVMAFTAPLWVVAVVLASALLLLRYPSGELTGIWSRWVERAVWVGLVLLWFGYLTGDSAVSDEVIGGRSPVPWPDWVAVVAIPGGVLVLGGLVFSAVHTVVRTLRASSPERQQLALLVTVAPLSVLLLFTPWSVLQLGLLAIPFAVAVGVLRYRLLGIEVIVRRTLVYGLLTALVVMDFALVTWALRIALGSDRGADLVAALLVTVVLAPARDGIQRAVDRFVYGARRDPARVYADLGREAAASTGLADVVAAVARSLRLPGAALQGPAGVLASWGDAAPTESVALVVAGEHVGELRVARRRGERALAEADARVLEGLAPLLGLALQSTLLAGDLAAERERVVATRLGERARLRQDLHDGLGPSLTGIGLGLEAAQSATPQRSHTILTRLREEVAGSLEEVRRILDDLRPVGLEGTELVALLREKAAQLTANTRLEVRVEAAQPLPPLPVAVETAVLRIVVEALTNVVRHADATCCTVRLAWDGAVLIEVSDDGVGYRGPRRGGVGVPSMRSRAEALGGTLELTCPGTGTLLLARLPA